MQDAPKAIWSIPYVSVVFFPSLKHNFIAYRSSKVSWCPDSIFEIHRLWRLGFSRVYSSCCCSCWFESEIKIGQSSHKMYSNNIVNFQESTTILNACIKRSGNLLKAPRHQITHKGCYLSIYLSESNWRNHKSTWLQSQRKHVNLHAHTVTYWPRASCQNRKCIRVIKGASGRGI